MIEVCRINILMLNNIHNKSIKQIFQKNSNQYDALNGMPQYQMYALQYILARQLQMPN